VLYLVALRLKQQTQKIVTMKNKIQTLLLVGLVATVALAAPAQQTQPSSPLYAGLQSAFDLNNTNSLVNADELNLTLLAKYNSESSRFGGGIRADWWVTDQQGAFIGFDEFADRQSYLSFGYGARTVFNSLEVAMFIGTRQDSDDPFGDVQLFMSPSASLRIVDNENFDVRLTLGADIANRGKPNPFFGITLRALRF
jgi:hypothetical protein